MIWAVGTGRCGTRSYAKQIGGAHEPKPRIYYASYIYYCYGAAVESLKESLEGHMRLGVPCVNNRYSFVIPLIKEVDKSAEIHWLLREPRACIESMMRYGFYTENDSRVESMEIDGFRQWPRLRKLCWYYKTTNELIRHWAPEAKLVLTEDLNFKENVNSNDVIVEWDDESLKMLDESKQLYEDITIGYFSGSSK